MIRVTTAAAMLAQIKARQAVKNELRHRGEKVTHYSARDITLMANDWLDAHWVEILPECKEQALAMILSGALGKRAQRAAQ